MIFPEEIFEKGLRSIALQAFFSLLCETSVIPAVAVRGAAQPFGN